MQNKQDHDELLLRYLLNEVNGEEHEFVVRWINESEANKIYFEDIKKAWKLLALRQGMQGLDVEQEWNFFKKSIDGTTGQEAFVENVEVLEIAGPEQKHNRGVVRRLLVGVAIAASVLLVIGAGWRFFYNSRNKEEQIVAGKQNGLKEQPIAFRHETNTSANPKKIVLSDGSIIMLGTGSELTYPEGFAVDKRDIVLTGTADFKVTKDSLRPFTVYSGAIATTALGTQFTVKAYVQSAFITVRLYEGKVVVRSIDSVKRKLNKNYYLLPGHELIYDTKNVVAKLQSFKANNKSEYLTEGNEKPNMPKAKGSWYMFNNQSLSQVFAQLKEMYHTDIVYNKKEVQNMYFIGTFNQNDSLETILQQIATLNNLKLSKEDNRFVIKK